MSTARMGTPGLIIVAVVVAAGGAACGVPRAKWQATETRAQRAEHALEDNQRRQDETAKKADAELQTARRQLAKTKQDLERARAKLKTSRQTRAQPKKPASSRLTFVAPSWIEAALNDLKQRVIRRGLKKVKRLGWFLHPAGPVALYAGERGGKMIVVAALGAPTGGSIVPLGLPAVKAKGLTVKVNPAEVVHRGHWVAFRLQASYFKGIKMISSSTWLLLRARRRLSLACHFAGTSMAEICALGGSDLDCSWVQERVQWGWVSGKPNELEVTTKEFADRRRSGATSRYRIKLAPRGICKKTKPRVEP